LALSISILAFCRSDQDARESNVARLAPLTIVGPPPILSANGCSMYLDRLRLDDRIAVVTGAAGGIGLAIGEALAEAGARVTIAGLARGAIDEAVGMMPSRGHSVSGVTMDVTDAARVTRSPTRLPSRPAGRA
jgi:hypothetical protein